MSEKTEALIVVSALAILILLAGLFVLLFSYSPVAFVPVP